MASKAPTKRDLQHIATNQRRLEAFLAAKARAQAMHAAERAVICAARAWVDFEGSSRDKSVELRAAVAELDRLEKL